MFVLSYNLETNSELKPEKTDIYMDLFTEGIKDSVKRDVTVYGRYRKPISLFNYYKNGKYKVIIWEYVPEERGGPIQIISTGVKNKLTAGQIYQRLNPRNVDVLVSQDSMSLKNELYLNFKGDSLVKSINSSNMVSYTLLLDELSIGNEKGGHEIWSVKTNKYSFEKHRVEIGFLQKGKRDYMILLLPSLRGPLKEESGVALQDIIE